MRKTSLLKRIAIVIPFKLLGCSVDLSDDPERRNNQFLYTPELIPIS